MFRKDKKEKKEKKAEKSEKKKERKRKKEKKEKKEKKPEKKIPKPSLRPLLPKDSFLELREQFANRAQHQTENQVRYASFPVGEKASNQFLEAKRRNELRLEGRVNRLKDLIPKKAERDACFQEKEAEIEADKQENDCDESDNFFASESELALPIISISNKSDQEFKIKKGGSLRIRTSTQNKLISAWSFPIGAKPNMFNFDDEDAFDIMSAATSSSTSGGDGWSSGTGDPIFLPHEDYLLQAREEKCLLGYFGRGETTKIIRSLKEVKQNKLKNNNSELSTKQTSSEHMEPDQPNKASIKKSTRGELERKKSKKTLALSGKSVKDIKEKMLQANEEFQKQQENRRQVLTQLGKVSRDLKKSRHRSLPEIINQFTGKFMDHSMPDFGLDTKTITLVSSSLTSSGSQPFRLWKSDKKPGTPEDTDSPANKFKK